MATVPVRQCRSTRVYPSIDANPNNLGRYHGWPAKPKCISDIKELSEDHTALITIIDILNYHGTGRYLDVLAISQHMNLLCRINWSGVKLIDRSLFPSICTSIVPALVYTTHYLRPYSTAEILQVDLLNFIATYTQESLTMKVHKSYWKTCFSWYEEIHARTHNGPVIISFLCKKF